MQARVEGLAPGDRLPFCYGMAGTGGYFSFEDQAGRPAVLVLAGEDPPDAVAALTRALAARRDAFTARGADTCLLVTAGARNWIAAEPPPGVTLVHCMDTALFDATPGARIVVADRGLRLAAALDGADPGAAVDAALAALDALPAEGGRDLSCPAPVLVSPGLLSGELCRRLIARFDSGEHVQGAMASIDGEGAGINRIDAAKKHRRDLTLDPGEPLHGDVMATLSTRLVPEIAKAFQAQVAHVDRILVARYDDAGGFFRRHRDNSAAHLAYREFALSVNLNAGVYEGGWLLFPEFNDHRHVPPTGAGMVFSASLLHEAAPVTRGRRYVLLTFLHGEAAERRRLATVS